MLMGIYRPRHGGSRGQARGVSLIEVLVSIVIATVGLLALAGVNASSVRYTKMSQYRGTSTQLATDLGERIRANKAGAANYSLITSFTGQAAAPTAPGTLCNTYSVTCNAAQLAAYDLYNWRLVVRSQLPEGSAYILYQNVQSAADVWVVWRDPAVANNDETPTSASECPAALSVAATPSVRCSYFRINL
jgi:type IV pilus assembly protein PilV